ncbi:MAG: transketolase [Actinobacteria bacterium]|nr:transketolase [Actinomycetota bacterium]
MKNSIKENIDDKKINFLKAKANQIRKDLIDMFYYSGKGHVGGSLSIVDILTVLYFLTMRIDPKKPKWKERDRLILSKGHASAAWYAALAEKGFFPKDLLFTQFIKVNGILQEHSDMRKIPGVDMSSGALGQGLSVALGMSLAGNLAKQNYRIFVIMGDGEMQSGQVWEALMACSHYKANNITVLVDYNKMQVNDYVSEIMEIEPLINKFLAFRWNVLEINGNDIVQIIDALHKSCSNSTDFPTAIICNTVKGKGISFMENNVKWHACHLSKEDHDKAMQELKGV